MKKYIERDELVNRIKQNVNLNDPDEQEWIVDECIRQAHAMPSVNVGEWISVDERLPDLETTRSDGYHRPKSVRVLCACEQRSGKVFVKEGYYELFSNKACWRIPGSIDSVTHWMPLPEPPKGAEQ